MDQSLKFAVHTFGCKVNTYDTGLIQKNLFAQGFVLSPDQSRIHVLNTCAVTGEATKQAVKLIRKLKVMDPFCTIVVTGCAAQVDTDAFSNLPGADLVVANSHKAEIPNLLRSYFKGTLATKVFKSNIFRKEDLEAGGGEEKFHTRSFLKIQDGCNSFCSFCIIPYARGKSRSLEISDLVRRVDELSAQGIAEVVLTGVHIGDYSDESKGGQRRGLEDLIETLLAKTRVSRFRLSSLEPIELSERLLDLFQDPRLCRHFHMSIQSAESQVLKDMKRKYDSVAVREALQNIETKVPGSFVGMDVIAGFPTESEAQFQEGIRVLADLPWTRLHVFPYSERAGTMAASKTESVPWAVRTRRAAQLRELSLARFQESALRQVGTLKNVLILKKPSRGAQGLARDYWNIEVNEAPELIAAKVGKEVLMKIEAFVPPGGKNQEGALRGSFYELC
jgi:threonylcarbamoyladenosine tRNA methylthiotransferase MtaB